MGKRISALESRHVDLGAGLLDWNDMAVPWTYHTHVDEEHAAVREAAGLFDISANRKIHIEGKDAFATVNFLLTRDMSKVYVGKSAYSLILNEDGGIEDDAIVYRWADDHYILVVGSGGASRQLEKAARGRDVTVRLDDDLHLLSLQGPAAVDFLDRHSSMDVHELRYFHHAQTTIFDHKIALSRTGYSGERGYEIFATSDVVANVWDEILLHGKRDGIRPCSFTCINAVRIEAGLHFFPFDMSPTTTPWEVGLGWAVSTTKSDYIGKEGAQRKRGNEQLHFVGVIANHDEAVGKPIAGGEKIFANGKEAGVMTASLYSRRLRQSIGFAHIKPFAAEIGTPIVIHGPVTVTGTVAKLPFYDPDKSRCRPT